MTRKSLSWGKFVSLAGKDQIAHATTHGLPRTACGRPRVAENLAWPKRGPRCPECLEALGLGWMAA